MSRDADLLARFQAEGVNYFTFAAPGNLFRSFSERSNPRSPYYQAWVGALPADLPVWASEVTALDQRSQLWHGSMQSHSDLSDSQRGPLATLLGMPPKSTWPDGIHAFHDVTLDGYFVCWSDPNLNISVVIYAVAAVFEKPSRMIGDNRRSIKDDLLNLMKSARIEPVK